MDVQHNKALYQRWFVDVVSRGELAAADDILTEDHRLHVPGLPGPVDRQGHQQLVAMFRTGSPTGSRPYEALGLVEQLRPPARDVNQGPS